MLKLPVPKCKIYHLDLLVHVAGESDQSDTGGAGSDQSNAHGTTSDQPQPESERNDACTAFVSNLAFHVDNVQLREIFIKVKYLKTSGVYSFFVKCVSSFHCIIWEE